MKDFFKMIIQIFPEKNLNYGQEFLDQVYNFHIQTTLRNDKKGKISVCTLNAMTIEKNKILSLASNKNLNTVDNENNSEKNEEEIIEEKEAESFDSYFFL